MTAAAQARRAEQLGARLPPLLAAAERVAATVAQGVHGRRRVGQGESFWQFRPFLPGDNAARIDWRRSARSNRAFVREMEWEAAQTVCLWRDNSASMHWRSRLAPVEKSERASLLLLAIASLLLRGGERVSLIGQAQRPLAGRAALDLLAEMVAVEHTGPGLPPPSRLPPHAQVVLIGDFLSPPDEVHSLVARLAGVPVRAHVLQVLDPAEALLPYAGRVRFRGLEAEAETLVPRVEGIREAYAERLAAHQAALASACTAAGFGFAVHHTDHPPEAALLGLYMALGPR